MSELSSEEELAAVVAALWAHRARSSPAVAEPAQDDTRWRFQRRWWLQGVLSLRQRPRPTL
ncbi:hypothetical protein [Acidimicrobium ferrooxidans]|uniref:hypothetical protein n=1 Tax=Acidimicrobium ferrooxidans TaxID=53635 RepID=UPI00019DE526|nr:hypothetical protein [Acidimicrobium ferrooxidans]